MKVVIMHGAEDPQLGYAQPTPLAAVACSDAFSANPILEYLVLQPTIACSIASAGLSVDDLCRCACVNRSFRQAFGGIVLKLAQQRESEEFEKRTEEFCKQYVAGGYHPWEARKVSFFIADALREQGPVHGGALMLLEGKLRFEHARLGMRDKDQQDLYRVMEESMRLSIQSGGLTASPGHAPVIVYADFIDIGSLKSPKIFVDSVAYYTKKLHKPGFAKPVVYGLFLDGNHIHKLEPGTFRELGGLRILSLIVNELKVIENGTLSGLKKLKILDMSSCSHNAAHGRAWSLSEGIFDGLGSLEYLSLDDNNIRKIDPKIFTPLKKLKILDLGNNPCCNQDLFLQRLHQVLPQTTIVVAQ